jgi:phosphate starvation-inducible protein PhoH
MSRKNKNLRNEASKLASNMIEPLTETQAVAFESWERGSNLTLLGTAGTGKTFLALHFALMALEKKQQRKVYIVRSVVPTRDMGYLPGNKTEKIKVYEQPYYSLCSEIYGRGDAYDIFKGKNQIEFVSTSFLRGTTFDDAVIIVDECQNMSDMELHTVMTRMGENSRVIFCGDTKQDDLSSERYKEYSGLELFIRITKNMEEFDNIFFNRDDIVRSDIVRSYIIAREELAA